jgi:hypothetical protein
MMTAYSGKNVTQKAAIQAEKALAALAVDLITHAAYPSYAIQQIARPSRGGGSSISQNACGCADDRAALRSYAAAA